MVTENLKTALRDPFVRGFLTGAIMHATLIIIAQRSSGSPAMHLNLSTDIVKALMDGETIHFNSPLGELGLLRIEI